MTVKSFSSEWCDGCMYSMTNEEKAESHCEWCRKSGMDEYNKPAMYTQRSCSYCLNRSNCDLIWARGGVVLPICEDFRADFDDLFLW